MSARDDSYEERIAHLRTALEMAGEELNSLRRQLGVTEPIRSIPGILSRDTERAVAQDRATQSQREETVPAIPLGPIELRARIEEYLTSGVHAGGVPGVIDGLVDVVQAYIERIPPNLATRLGTFLLHEPTRLGEEGGHTVVARKVRLTIRPFREGWVCESDIGLGHGDPAGSGPTVADAVEAWLVGIEQLGVRP